MALGTLADARAAAGQPRQACAAYTETLATFDKIRAAGRLTKLDEDNAVRTMKDHRARHCH
jgi:hypothetical protein